MATTHASPFELHDHAGARWLAAAGTPLALALAALLAMLAYPYL